MENKLIRSKYFLYLTEFFAGMSVMAVELGASRLMAPYFSSSQIVWTVIIGVIMIAMAIGNVWGGKLADKSATPDKLYRRLIIAAIWIALIPFVGRYLIAGISLLLALFALRLLALLPCTLALGAAAMEKSRELLLLSLGGGGKRTRAVTYGGAYWYRFGACCVCLLLAALIELWLVPQFLLLAAR